VTARVPRVYRAEAVILRQRRLGEADRVLTLYTPQLGKLDAVAKGVRKQTSRKAGHLEPLTWASLLLAHGQNLDIVTQSETVESFLPLRVDLDRLARGMYVAELVDRFSEQRVENFAVFRLLAETLQRLCATQSALDLPVRFFELHLLSAMGYRPQLDRCVACAGALQPITNAFSAGLGGVICADCREEHPASWRLSVNALKVLRLLQRGDYEAAAALRLNVDLQAEMEQILRGYIRYVLEASPRSAAFVDALRRGSMPLPDAQRRMVAESGTARYLPEAVDDGRERVALVRDGRTVIGSAAPRNDDSISSALDPG
jgi:DNA repair protein RecO (recombination protein O)